MIRGNFNILTITATVAMVCGYYVTLRIHHYSARTLPTRYVFDFCRMGLIWLLGDITVSLAQWVDPVVMGTPWNQSESVMATSTLMLFMLRTVSWGAFFFFQWQTLTGRHPWDHDARSANERGYA